VNWPLETKNGERRGDLGPSHLREEEVRSLDEAFKECMRESMIRGGACHIGRGMGSSKGGDRDLTTQGFNSSDF